jgi:GT2 family glycosyltransferase
MTTPGRPAPRVLVVAYRSDDHLPGCLGDLAGGDSVLVIDNDASDATRVLAAEYGVRYMAAPGNVGFAAAVNLGLDEAWDGRSDVLLLNPDARLAAADLLLLQDALHAPGSRRAAVGPRLVGTDGRPQRPSWPLPSPGQVWFDALGLTRLWRGRRFVVGAVLLLHGEALGEVGRLDERYFLYAEEADWQLRAQRLGWTVAVVDSVVAAHVGGASSGEATIRDGLFHASAEAFARRWHGRLGWRVMRAGSLVAAGRRSLVGSTEAKARNRRAVGLYLRRRPPSAVGERAA